VGTLVGSNASVFILTHVVGTSPGQSYIIPTYESEGRSLAQTIKTGVVIRILLTVSAIIIPVFYMRRRSMQRIKLLVSLKHKRHGSKNISAAWEGSYGSLFVTPQYSPYYEAPSYFERQSLEITPYPHSLDEASHTFPIHQAYILGICRKSSTPGSPLGKPLEDRPSLLQRQGSVDSTESEE